MFRADRWLFEPSEKADEPYEEIIIEEARQRDGSRKYAIRRGGPRGECFSKTGAWEYEPSPSSRTDEWFRQFRFDTWEDAAKAVEKYWRNAKAD